ncbi:MAG TPA: hypothetical protein VGP94_03600, partial [Tepidisphaeraceae bacterium]|nr:hypothetical protein [Tepidisphaeraceae bacterium]
MNLRLFKRNVTFLATLAVCVLLYGIASARYEGFFSARVFVNFLSDNAVLGIAAIGLTFVILSGGIDLSVGGMIGAVSIMTALLIETKGISPTLAIMGALIIGTLFGTGMGTLIHFCALPPFLVTLAGMFLVRGTGFMMKMESMPISKFGAIADAMTIPLGPRLEIPSTATIFLVLLLAGFVVAHFTRFGRNVYAIGGNEQSAILMGLPVGRTKIAVYALSGFCSALAGVVYTFYTASGNPTAGTGLELEAIAAVVIGGTLL